MATCRERENGHFEFVVRRKRLLPKPIYLTFESREAGERYCAELEKLLDAGVVPDEFKRTSRNSLTLAELVRRYTSGHTPKTDDIAKLNLTVLEHGNVRVVSVDYAWVETYVARFKRDKKLSPSTISKYVGALSRCLSWAWNKGLIADNPIKRLPRGYAQYSPEDVRVAGVARKNISRDMRVPEGCENKIRAAIAAKADGAAYLTLFVLAIESAMRLREMATLSISQVNFDERTVFLEKTKNGDKRQVPLSSPAQAQLKDFIGDRTEGFLFPWWSGDPTTLGKLSSRLSKAFSRIFADAGCGDLRFHDLRHEATSRLFERTTLTDTEIAKITGHKDPRVLMRYANLRGSSLASRLW
jgi:integrase